MSGDFATAKRLPFADGLSLRSKAPGHDGKTFNRQIDTADLVIPIIDFGQTVAWAPATMWARWGAFVWWWRWVATTLGWIITALGAAAITGIIRRD